MTEDPNNPSALEFAIWVLGTFVIALAPMAFAALKGTLQ